MKEIKTFPNQRIISVNKQPTDKKHPYTTNNLCAINEAVNTLQSLAGFKLYMYLAMNQNNYTFALSSKDFTQWANVSKTAYHTAFNELVSNGYLVPIEDKPCCFVFNDMKQKQQKEDSNTNLPEKNKEEFSF